ncbi:MAG: TIM barrel protein [Planctomycetaceae bacterium]|nr:TIM barrel protein [Planctomycetaceae bacterium]
MDRRTFVALGASVGSGLGLTMAAAPQAPRQAFKLKYAPGFGTFKNHCGEDPLDAIAFCADQGFGAMFDNGLMGRPADVQEKIAAAMKARNMELGPFVLYADFGVKSFVKQDDQTRKMLTDKVRQGVETAKRTGAKWALMVPGRYDESLEWDYQTANVIDNLKYCMDVAGPANLVIVLEPLNPHNHPGLFLTKMPQTYQICKAVNHPCCKIVNDMYHQQITEGNLIPNIDRSWSEIASFHIGDNPGRKEPTTGEINYKNIFRHIHGKGFDGVLCMEHGTSGKGKEGEQALLAAYRACDDF